MRAETGATWRRVVAILMPAAGSARLLALFVATSMPATLLALWVHGGGVASDDSWGAQWTAVGVGLIDFGPPVVVAMLTSLAWERLFATMRRRRADAGWFMSAWLYVLLLPASLPLPLVAAGASFGAVFGLHAFGGTGRYVASPALLGALFVTVAYPQAAGGEPAWAMLPAYGAALGPVDWAFAVTCLAGGATLVVSGATSVRTLAGALTVLLMACQLDIFDAARQFAAGAFAFGWAFVLSDPSTQALTRAGRWLHGATFTCLVVLIRRADPAGVDGVLVALLLAGLVVPLFDVASLALRRRLRGESLELR